MKKLLSIILTIILTLSICVTYTGSQIISINADTKSTKNDYWPKAPEIFGTTGVLIEASTGTVLYNKKAHKKMYPASITKIMTALLTIENCKLDDTVVYSEKAVTSIHYDEANVGCQVGEKMSVKDCLYALMLASANEVATALGEHIAGSVDKFTDMMNERAKEAGALNTHFANANGLHDPNHYVTAYDMAMITRAAANYPLFNEVVNTTTYTLSKNNKRKNEDPVNQRHQMIWPSSSVYYEGIIGGKTGYTDQARTTLVTYAKRNGITLIAVVLHSNGTNVYNDTKLLLDYGFDNFKLANVSENDKRFTNSNTLSLQSPFCSSTDAIYLDKDSNVVLPKNVDFSKLTSTVAFNSSDDSFATITYKLGDTPVGTSQVKYESNASSSNNDKETTETVTKTSSDNTDKNTNQEEKSSKNTVSKNIKISKKIVMILITLVIVVLLIILIIRRKQKLDRIRKMKRHRNR